MTIERASIGAALPLLLNPATLGLVALGAVGFGLYHLLREDQEEGGLEGPSDSPVMAPLDPVSTLAPTVEEAMAEADPLPCEADDAVEDHDVESEGDAARQAVIREAMSELGKRSAAARARKKAAVALTA